MCDTVSLAHQLQTAHQKSFTVQPPACALCAQAAVWRGFEDAPHGSLCAHVGARVMRRILRVGEDSGPQERVEKLLGRGSLRPVQGGGAVPDLGADAWQDVDLLG